MQRDAKGDWHYESAGEAVESIRDDSRSIVRWLHECRESGTMQRFQQFRSLLNDIANQAVRWIEDRERLIERLTKPRICPSCGAEVKTEE